MRLMTFLIRRNREWIVLFIISFCLALVPSIDAQTTVNVTLKVTVTFAANDVKPESCEILIARQGKLANGTPLREIRMVIDREGNLIKGGSSDGFEQQGNIFSRPDTDFALTHTSQAVTINAQGYRPVAPFEITDDKLRSADGKVFEIPIQLTKDFAAKAFAAGSPGVKENQESGIFTVLGVPNQVTSKLNFIIWLLGLTGLLLFSGWLILVILMRIFRRHEAQRQILRLAPLVASSCVRPFGFILQFSLRHKDVPAVKPELILRAINEDLNNLVTAEKPESTLRSNAQDVVDNLSALVGAKPEVTIYLNGIETSLLKLTARKTAAAEQTIDSASTKDLLKGALREVLAEDDLVIQKRPDEPEKPPTGSDSESRMYGSPQIMLDSGKQTRAKLYYGKFLHHEQFEPKPIFLEVAAQSSIFGKLADDNTYLLQVTSSQAPFVLFVDEVTDGRTGMVFPNPVRGFDQSTLRKVFPNLSEAQFDAKAEIEPVPVIKEDERRWKVVRSLAY